MHFFFFLDRYAEEANYNQKQAEHAVGLYLYTNAQLLISGSARQSVTHTHPLMLGSCSECILPWARLFKLIISFIANPEALHRQLIPVEG